MKNIVITFWIVLLLGVVGHLRAQTTLQVATKQLQKEYEGIHTIYLDTEKADIEIVVWNKAKVSLEVSWSAKHPEKEIATRDLNLLKIEMISKKGGLTLRNFLLIAQNDKKPESNFKTKFILKIPEKLDIEIRNSFGKINIQGETKKLVINSEFCILHLNQIKGNSKIQTKYGEVFINGLEGVTAIKSERTNLNIKHFSGTQGIHSYYGTVILNEPLGLQSLTISADKSDIKLEEVTIKKYNIALSTSFGKLIIPSELGQINTLKNSQNINFTSNEKASIKIINKAGNITLEKR